MLIEGEDACKVVNAKKYDGMKLRGCCLSLVTKVRIWVLI